MKEELRREAEAIRRGLEEFAQELVRTRSFTCCEEAAARLVFAKMEELGFQNLRIDGAGSVVGSFGEGPDSLMFDSHMDTVGVGDTSAWSHDPFGGEIADGRLWGRGAADMKCPLAASVYGAWLANRLGLPAGRSVTVSASTMEEDYDGEAAKEFFAGTDFRPRLVVVCEPTSLKIATGHRGRAMMEIKMAGRAAHGSTPEKGINPVYLLQEVVARVEKLAAALAARPGEHGSVALTNIFCTTASNNSVPQDASIILDRRLALGETEADLAAEMDELVRGTKASWRWYDIPGKTWRGAEFTYHSCLPAWEIAPDHELVRSAQRACESVLGAKAELFKLGCSTNAVTFAGVLHIPTIVLGPGSLEQAHARDEYCDLRQMLDAAVIYAEICRS